MIIKQAIYKTSVVDAKKILDDGVPEFAFVGRSNVGKSSLINMLTGQKKLAKASSTPGLTKMVNYFDINNSFRLVDLPGYGYAKAGKSHKNLWAGLMGEYLTKSPSLLTVFVLLDIRHEPNDLDKQMLEFLIYNNLPFMILATKCDKLSKFAQNKQKKVIASKLSIREQLIILTSSSDGLGRENILEYIENTIEASK